MSQMCSIPVLLQTLSGNFKRCVIHIKTEQLSIRSGAIQDPRCMTAQT
jgi:hypothetical protein